MKRAVLLIIPFLVLCGCQQNQKPRKTEFQANYTLLASLRKADSQKTGGYDLTFDYKDSYFKVSATTFSKDLALLSYGVSLMSDSEDNLKGFYQTCEFDNIESHYVTTQSADSASFMFAHRKVNGQHLISITTKGFNYDQEWGGNLIIGNSGNHQNFEAKAREIYTSLKTYLGKYKDPLLWITGYSRAAGISNVLAHCLLSSGEINVPKEKMYVYCFETPKGVDVNDKVAYENVFNVVNSRDLITLIAPEEQYGLARCGVDVDIYTDNFQEVIHAFDEDIEVKDFTPYEYQFNTEAEFQAFFLNTITADYEDDDDHIYIHTRNAYATNAQPAIRYAAEMIFNLSKETKNAILGALKAQLAENPYSLLTYITTKDTFYNFLTPYLDEAGYEYDPEELSAHVEAIRKIVYSQAGTVMSLMSDSSEYGNNIKRGISMHYPEINYVLLNNYVVPTAE